MDPETTNTMLLLYSFMFISGLFGTQAWVPWLQLNFSLILVRLNQSAPWLKYQVAKCKATEQGWKLEWHNKCNNNILHFCLLCLKLKGTYSYMIGWKYLPRTQSSQLKRVPADDKHVYTVLGMRDFAAAALKMLSFDYYVYTKNTLFNRVSRLVLKYRADSCTQKSFAT